MKVKVAIKRMCKDCKIVRRRGRLRVVCKTNPRHKQRQPLHTSASATASTAVDAGNASEYSAARATNVSSYCSGREDGSSYRDLFSRAAPCAVPLLGTGRTFATMRALAFRGLLPDTTIRRVHGMP